MIHQKQKEQTLQQMLETDTIPLITTQIEIRVDDNEYNIGKTQNNQYCLMYEVKFRRFKSASSNYIPFIHQLLSNNLIPFHLFFHGVYFDKTRMKHFLIYEYPNYFLFHASRSEVFNKLKLIKDFISFLDQMTPGELMNLILKEDLIFFNDNKELRVICFGNLNKVSLPGLKNVWKKKVKKSKEAREDIILSYLIRFILSLGYLADKRLDEQENKEGSINESEEKKKKIFETIWNSTVSELKDIGYKNVFESISSSSIYELVLVLDFIFENIKLKVSSSEIIGIVKQNFDNKLKETEEYKMKLRGKFDKTERTNFDIEFKPYSAFMIGNGSEFQFHWYNNTTTYNNDKDKVVKVNAFREKCLLFMFRYFAVNDSKEQRIFYTEPTWDFKKDCLVAKKIPRVKKPKAKRLDQNQLQLNQIKPKEDNWINFKYIPNYPGIFKYKLSFSPNELSSPMILRYLQQSKAIWPHHSLYPFHEDISLNFLTICNYDVYKALYSILFLHPIYIKYLLKVNQISN